jgi:hypothetical protein
MGNPPHSVDYAHLDTQMTVTFNGDSAMALPVAVAVALSDDLALEVVVALAVKQQQREKAKTRKIQRRTDIADGAARGR